MINENDFLHLTGIPWGNAWAEQWQGHVDHQFVDFVERVHELLDGLPIEDSRLRCALELFCEIDSEKARSIGLRYIDDRRGPIRWSARRLFETHFRNGWIQALPAWFSEGSFDSPILTKRQRQRKRKYGEPFTKDHLD